MAVRMKTKKTMIALAVGLILTAGCSGKSVKYGAASEGGEDQPDQAESVGTATPYSGGVQGKRFAQGTGVDGGSVDGTKAYIGPDGKPIIGPDGKPIMVPQGSEGMDGSVASSTSPNGSDYGHDYDGVSGSGPNKGPVTGFGKGQAGEMNPGPEQWANAYLRDGESSQEFYGDPDGSNNSEASGSSSGSGNGTLDGFSKGSAGRMAADPEKWAEDYQDENGGPSPEFVDPTMQIAKVDPQQSQENSFNNESNQSSSPRSSMSNGTSSLTFGEGPGGRIQDIYFAFDSWSITPQAAEYLKEGAQWMQENPGNIVTIEGHCDQRGTQDYNLVLGKKRAEATRNYLIDLGIQAERVKIVSYGKERPFCQQENENCYQENRRSHMVVKVN